jgi:hypothetical protein
MGCPARAGLRGVSPTQSNLIRAVPAEGTEMRAKLPHIAADILMRLRARSLLRLMHYAAANTAFLTA